MPGGFLPRLFTLLIAISSLTPALAFTPDRLGFSVRVGDEVSSYRVLGIFVLPGQALEIEVLAGSETFGGYRLEATAGLANQAGRESVSE